jgi:hypothetical protein
MLNIGRSERLSDAGRSERLEGSTGRRGVRSSTSDMSTFAGMETIPVDTRPP